MTIVLIVELPDEQLGCPPPPPTVDAPPSSAPLNHLRRAAP